jgi:hypothetical protein
VPTAVDHSQSSPGPSTSGADRAGFTRVRQRARVSFAWDNGPARADGMVPFFCRSANVFFWLDDFAVAISSDYPAGSCAYNVTRRHEFESHLYRPIKIFHSYRDRVIARLNAIVLPTQRAPTWVAPHGIAALQQALEQQVVQAVGAVRQELLQALRRDRDAEDSAASYRLVHNQCSAAEWARGAGP